MVSSRLFAITVVFVFAFPKTTSGLVPSSTAAPVRALSKNTAPVDIAQDKRRTLVVLKDSIRGSASNEESRQYRRTVYTSDDWPEHRSPDRFQKAVSTIFISQVYKGLALQVSTFTLISTLVVLWNALAGGYVDFNNVRHEPFVDFLPMLVLPLQVFTLTSASLGLLLVFRTNASYGRWDEARKLWGLMINRSRDIVRMGVTWYAPGTEQLGYMEGVQGSAIAQGVIVDQEERQRKLERLSKSVWSFSRALARHLTAATDEDAFQNDIRATLDPEQAETLIAAVHRPNRAMFDVGCAINDLPMHFMRRNQMDADVTTMEDIAGGCERIFSSPIPLVYTRHTARFLGLYLLFLPFGMYEAFSNSWNHLALIPSVAVISLFLMGLSELAVSLEEPFSILPLIGISDKIGANCRELASWEPRIDDMHVNVIDINDSRRLSATETATETATEIPRLSSFESFVLQQKSIDTVSTQQLRP